MRGGHAAPALVAAALVARSPSGAQDAPFPPFAFEDVDFARDCTPTPTFERVMALLVPRALPATGDTVPAVDIPLLDVTPGAVQHALKLGREVDWHGLHLVEVRLYQGVESGPTNHSLVFSDSPERVREVWSARGWDLPPVGQTRVVADDGIAVAVGIEQLGERTAVTCFVD